MKRLSKKFVKELLHDAEIWNMMEKLRQEGLTKSPEYRRLHRKYYVENYDKRIWYQTL